MSKTYTPFADEFEQQENVQQEAAVNAVQEQYAAYTPFASNYEAETATEGEWETDPVAHEYYEMLEELEDTEFESAVDNLVTEMQEQLAGYETAGGFMNETGMQQLAAQYLAPVEQQANQLLETIAFEMEATSMSQMQEQEFEAIFDNAFNARNNYGTPAQELFLKKFVNKAKAVVKKVAAAAKKISPVHILLKKLQPMIKPLLERILSKALNFLPASIRPIAKKLANRLFNKADAAEGTEEGADTTEQDTTEDASGGEGEFFAGSENEQPTVYSSANIQAELDHYLSQFATATNESEQNRLAAEYENAVEKEVDTTNNELDTAREKFVLELENLKEGESPVPALENFLPVVLKAAKFAAKGVIAAVGRPKVVSFLAGLMAKWMSKYIAPENANKLATVMADKGLKLLKLEAGEQENNRVVFEALANTVEEAASRISGVSNKILSNTEMLSQETYEAFETAAAAYFPDSAIKFEARESETGNGYWQRKGQYLKFTKNFTVQLTASQLKAVTTFGGTNILQFVTDTLGKQVNKPVEAVVHIYQIAKGGTLSKLTLNEKDIPGLGTASRNAYNQIHPLTKQAAAVILGEPGLGKDVRPVNNRTRNLVFDGERFYFLEIKNTAAQPAITPDAVNINSNGGTVDITPVQKSTQLNIMVSGSLRAGLVVKCRIYISEKDSRNILEGLKNQSFAALYSTIKNINPGLVKNYFGDKHKIGGTIMKGLQSNAVNAAKEQLSKIAVEKIKDRIAYFEKAVKDPKDGVTITVQFTFQIHKGKKIGLAVKEAIQNSQMGIVPGLWQRAVPLTHTTPFRNAVKPNNSTFIAAITPVSSPFINVKRPSAN